MRKKEFQNPRRDNLVIIWHLLCLQTGTAMTLFPNVRDVHNGPTDAIMVTLPPWIGVGPGFNSQGSVNFFLKYCFANLRRIHVESS